MDRLLSHPRVGPYSASAGDGIKGPLWTLGTVDENSLHATITYNDLQSLTIDGGPVQTAFDVQSTEPRTMVSASGQAGQSYDVVMHPHFMIVTRVPITNLVDVGNASNSLDGIQGALTVDGGASSETLNILDQGNASVTDYNLTATTLARTHAATITFSGLSKPQSSININGGGATTRTASPGRRPARRCR